jgi:phosphohistidine phosphatase
MGRWLVTQRLQPEAIIASTATRARCTAELLASQLRDPPPVQAIESLYLPSTSEIVETAGCEGGEASRLLVVCHNPGVSEAVHALSGVQKVMSHAAIATIDFEIDVWSDLLLSPLGVLRHLWCTEDLPSE